jgi:hypothetical protein
VLPHPKWSVVHERAAATAPQPDLFWHVVSGPAAVCEFGVANMPRPAVGVRLAISASIGCETRTRHFHVEDGDLVPG